MTFEEFKEMEDFLFEEMKKWDYAEKSNTDAINFDETDCEDIDFSEAEKSENSTFEEWKEKEKQRIESLEKAVERKSQTKMMTVSEATKQQKIEEKNL